MIDVTAYRDFGEPGIRWNYRRMIFSGGEIQVRLDGIGFRPEEVVVLAHLRRADEIIELLMLTNAIRNASAESVYIRLRMPYFPYARQDRVCAPGEAFSAEVMAELINLCRFKSVELWDVHSNVSMGLLNHAENVQAHRLMPIDIVGRERRTVVVAPDKGAIERARACADWFGLMMICADKIRDPDTGEILRTEVPFRMENGKPVMTDEFPDDGTGEDFDPAEVDFFIVDDLCDGGRTFIELARILKGLSPNGKNILWVTHGIFSKGFEVFAGLIDEIYTANCFVEDVPAFVHVGYNPEYND